MTTSRWRRTAARLVVAGVLAGGLVPLMSGAAWACSCVGYSSEDEQYRAAAREAKVIYSGVVTEETRASQPPSAQPQPPPDVRYTIRVEEDLKGGASGTREVTTSDNEASCGISLRTGARALLVEHAGDRRIGLCDGTTQERVDERAAIVRDEVRRNPAPPRPAPSPGSPTAPEPPSLPRTGGAAPGTAVAVALVAGVAVVIAATRRRVTT